MQVITILSPQQSSWHPPANKTNSEILIFNQNSEILIERILIWFLWIDQSKWRYKFDKLILTKIKISRDSESDEDKTEKRKAGSPVLDPTQQKRQKIEVNTKKT